MNEEIKTIEFGSEEMKKAVEYTGGDYVKFELGEENIVEVDYSKGAIQYEKKFDNEEYPVTRFDISVKVEKQDGTLWSVSRKVLDTINTYSDRTNKFLVIRKKMNYDVVPLGLK